MPFTCRWWFEIKLGIFLIKQLDQVLVSLLSHARQYHFGPLGEVEVSVLRNHHHDIRTGSSKQSWPAAQQAHYNYKLY